MFCYSDKDDNHICNIVPFCLLQVSLFGILEFWIETFIHSMGVACSHSTLYDEISFHSNVYLSYWQVLFVGFFHRTRECDLLWLLDSGIDFNCQGNQICFNQHLINFTIDIANFKQFIYVYIEPLSTWHQLW